MLPQTFVSHLHDSRVPSAHELFFFHDFKGDPTHDAEVHVRLALLSPTDRLIATARSPILKISWDRDHAVGPGPFLLLRHVATNICESFADDSRVPSAHELDFS